MSEAANEAGAAEVATADGPEASTGTVGKRRDLPVFPLSPEPVRPDVPRDVSAVTHEIEPRGGYDGPRIGLVTLGCDKNTVDSERMMAALVGHGARVSSEVEGADVVIVNTCGFIEAAKEQSIETILEACALKEQGDLQAVVAVGCMVQRYKEELREEIPEVDLFMGLTDLGTLVPALKEKGLLAEPEPGTVPNMERPLRILATDTPHTSHLKISEGCDHSCAFCAIPLMRGLHRSMPLEELVAEARGLGRAGVRELNVISQDTTWYGRDLKRRDPDAPLLQDLLEALTEDTGVPWYRLFYMYPSGIGRELVELMARNADKPADGSGGAKVVPYLDMPLQHGSDRMLKAMRRPERQKTIRERVAWLRDAIPDLTLRTTVIVGFPGETDDDFRELLDLLEEIEFDRVGAFTYSIEEGTPAADMPDQLPESLKKERLEELMDVQRSISLEKNLERVGAVETVLIDRRLDGDEADPDVRAVGRTQGQAADVDGHVQIVHAAEATPRTPALEPGDMVRVEIVDAMEYDLIGRVVE